MHLGLASLESIAMSIGAHVKELDLGGQKMWATKKSWDVFKGESPANADPPQEIRPYSSL